MLPALNSHFVAGLVCLAWIFIALNGGFNV